MSIRVPASTQRASKQRAWTQWALPIALALAAMFLLVACGDDEDGGDADATTEATGAASEATSDATTESTATTEGTPQGTAEGEGSTETREGPAIVLGGFDFGESQILAEIYAQQLEANGFAVDRSKLQPGSQREILKPALESGEIGLVPEYVGTLVTFLGGQPTSDGAENHDLAADLYAGSGVTVLDYAEEAENTNAFVTTSELSEELGLQRMSDLAGRAGDLKLGGPAECPEREFCLIGLQEVYGVEFGEFVPLDFGPRVTALEEGGIDVAVMFSTDAEIAVNEWIVLGDDMGLQPAENIAPVIRTELIDTYGDDLVNALNAVTAKLTSESLQEMNAEFQVEQRDAADIAEEWLIENDLVEG